MILLLSKEQWLATRQREQGQLHDSENEDGKNNQRDSDDATTSERRNAHDL